MNRSLRLAAIAALCLASPALQAYVLLPNPPASRWSMNLDLQPVTPFQTTGYGLKSWNALVQDVMAIWNQTGIGPGPDTNFFSTLQPAVSGDACNYDGINEVRWASDECGTAFGSALAVTIAWSNNGKRIEEDMLLNTGLQWDAYTGPLRHAANGSAIYDVHRVVLHELGHAAGLDHPDEHVQTVSAIMNAHISNLDALQADDVAGAHAINWSSNGLTYYTLDVTNLGGGTVSSVPAGINCPSSACTQSYLPATTLTLTAVADGIHVFNGWSGDCSGTGACVLSMNRSRSVSATFQFGSAIAPQTGYWWNPNEGGRGFALEKRGNNLFMATYLYDASGRSTWYGIGPGAMNGATYSGTLTSYSNGQTLTGAYKAPTNNGPSGNVTVTFSSGTQGTMTWPGGTIPIQKYDFGPGGSAAAQPAGTPEPGWWWAPTEGGRGYAIEVQGGQLFIAGYMYDALGSPLWYASGPAPMADGLTYYQGTWQQYGNGQTLTGTYKSPGIVNANVGSVTIQFSSATAGTLFFPDGRQVAIQRYPF